MNEIKCKNCGALYDSALQLCPYCGAENELEAKRRKLREDQAFEQEKKTIENLPQTHSVKKKKIATIVLVSAAAVLFIAGAVTMGINNRKTVQEEAQREADQAAMEALFQNGDYEAIYEKCVNESLYGSYREKYWEVGAAYNWMEFMRDTKAALEERKPDSYYGIAYALSGNRSALSEIQDGLTDGVNRGNEDVLRGFQEEIEAFFREELQMTDEEIAELEKTEKNEYDYDAMDAVLMERLGLKRP